MNIRKSLWKRAALAGILAVIVIFIAFCVYNGVQTNQNKISPQIEVFSLGETVELGNNYFTDAVENPDGYSITVNSAELV